MIETAKRLNTVEEYYFSQKLRQVRQMLNAGMPIINLGVGSPDLSPPKEVITAMQQALFDEQAHQYQSYQGIPELRAAMADFYQNHFQVLLEPNSEILPLMGSKEGIMHISMAFLNEGDSVLIPNPGYPTYASVTKLVGATPLYYDLHQKQNWLPNLKEIEKQDLSRVKLMWLSYPHMPTGALATIEIFEELIDFAEKHNILLVNDNPYGFILNEKKRSLLSMPGAKEVALELNSLSKTFNMSGWRIGMVLGKSTFLDAILKVKSNMDSGMFYPLQKGAIAALKLNEEWFASQNEIYKRRRDLIYNLVTLMGCTYEKHKSGLFVWAKLPSSNQSAEVFIEKILIEKNIFISPGTVFGSRGEGYIRFSLCVSEEKIKEAISRF
ncbi:MAG: aminotransferase class I/II-fold pyridoxal phosphate-dependent enzyme [Flavobacteriaceae bacterium]|nr:aminotransferase class I/II-fold pyridoxal phosphate-dependent enzyme [Flavobacteriaceae bacterium]